MDNFFKIYSNTVGILGKMFLDTSKSHVPDKQVIVRPLLGACGKFTRMYLWKWCERLKKYFYIWMPTLLSAKARDDEETK